MQKKGLSLWIVLGIATILLLVFFNHAEAPAPEVSQPAPPVTENPQVCNQDAKVCPDGSSVGRIGADCHFAACPSPTATSATIRTTLGQKMTGLGVTVTPMEVTEDSRCPKDVQCIWAGTVKVSTRIESGMGVSTMILEIGKPVTTEAETITLTEVTPEKSSGEAIPGSSYRLVFKVEKR